MGFSWDPSLISIFSSKIANFFSRLNNEYSLIHSQTLRIMRFLLRIFDEFFSGFRAKFQKIVTCVAFSIKFAKTNLNFAKKIHYYSELFTSPLTRYRHGRTGLEPLAV